MSLLVVPSVVSNLTLGNWAGQGPSWDGRTGQPHFGHKLQKVGTLNVPPALQTAALNPAGGSADVWYCVQDNVLLIDITTPNP